MARCISRYAFLLALDLLPRSTRAQVVDLAKGYDSKFDVDTNTLDDLLKSVSPPSTATMTAVFRLLNKLLERNKVPVVPQLLVDEAIRFDSANALHSDLSGEAKLERIRALLENQGLYGAWSLGLRKARGAQNPTHLTADGRAVAVVLLEFMRFLACFEVEDLVGPDGMPGDLVRDGAKVKALNAAADALTVVREQLSDVEERARAGPGREDRFRFASLRLSVHLNVLLTKATRMEPGARLGERNGLSEAWNGLEITQLVEEIHPMAMTTRVLRNCIEAAQYSRQTKEMMAYWDRLKPLFRNVKGDPLRHQPKSWAAQWQPLPAIAEDDLLCSAGQLLDRYEAGIARGSSVDADLEECGKSAVAGFSFQMCCRTSCRLHRR